MQLSAHLWHFRPDPLRCRQILHRTEEAEGGAQRLYKLYVLFRLFQQQQEAVNVFVSWRICYPNCVFCGCRHLASHGEPTSQGKRIAAPRFAGTQHLAVGTSLLQFSWANSFLFASTELQRQTAAAGATCKVIFFLFPFYFTVSNKGAWVKMQWNVALLLGRVHTGVNTRKEERAIPVEFTCL